MEQCANYKHQAWRRRQQLCRNAKIFLSSSREYPWRLTEVAVLVPFNRSSASVLSTWIIMMRKKKEWTLLFFLSFPLLLCISLMLHKCHINSTIFSSGNCELLRAAKVPRDSCSQNFFCLCSLQPPISEIQYREYEIWTWGAAGTTYSKQISWGPLRKKFN